MIRLTTALLLLSCNHTPARVPVTNAPVSTVKCFDKFGNVIFSHVSRDRPHQLSRVGCISWLRCCVSDPWTYGEPDKRPWGIGFEGDAPDYSAAIVDGVDVTCTVVRGYIP